MCCKVTLIRAAFTPDALMICVDDLIRHNRGDVPHTSKWKPWRIKTYIALSDRERARSFETYLKSASGRAFVKKRL